MVFISPTEPPTIKELGVVSSMPERYGVDIMWNSKLGTIGVQRKVFPGDFLASMTDGRLTLEFNQMKQLDMAVLLLEGKPQWTTEGELVGSFGRGRQQRQYTWSRNQHRNYLTSVQMRNVYVQTSDSISDTVTYIRSMRMWSDKGDHSSLDRRPTNIPQADPWGGVTNADYVRWLYQSLPGVGPRQASLIWEKLGVIFRLVVDAEDLQTVPGIGKGRAKKIVEVFSDKLPHPH